jgi:hypothetical protein
MLSRVTLAALAAACLAPAPLAGQGHLLRAELQATLAQDPAQAEVRIRYEVRPGSASDRLRVAVIPLAGVQLVGLSAAVGPAPPAPLILRPRDPMARADGERDGTAVQSRLEGEIALAAATGSPVIVDLRYRVVASGSEPVYPRRIELPIVAALWPPESPEPGTFRGSVAVHPGLRLRDAFPADLERMASMGPDPDGARIHRFDLPVTPAMLAFTLSRGGRNPSLAAVLDGAALLAVLAFGYVGWRRFRVEM